VIHPSALQIVLLVPTGWLERRERDIVAHLIEIEENRLGATKNSENVDRGNRVVSPVISLSHDWIDRRRAAETISVVIWTRGRDRRLGLSGYCSLF
jgi:hypothetical protein